MGRESGLLSASCVLRDGCWGYTWIVQSGGSRFGRGDCVGDWDGDCGCVINGRPDFWSLVDPVRTALHLSLPPFLPIGTWHVPLVAEDDFPEGEEDDDDEEGSVIVTEGREGFVYGLELSRILADMLERYPMPKYQRSWQCRNTLRRCPRLNIHRQTLSITIGKLAIESPSRARDG